MFDQHCLPERHQWRGVEDTACCFSEQFQHACLVGFCAFLSDIQESVDDEIQKTYLPQGFRFQYSTRICFNVPSIVHQSIRISFEQCQLPSSSVHHYQQNTCFTGTHSNGFLGGKGPCCVELL